MEEIKLTKTAIFPGSFDPVTNGHLDIIDRALKVFDRIIVAVSSNEGKCALFTIAERRLLLESVCAEMKGVEIISFDGLLVKAVEKFHADAVVRGLRAISDFEYEFQMALMNRELDRNAETVFLMSSPQYSFLSSRMIKEIVRLGGDVSAFVPAQVMEALQSKKSGLKKI